MLPSSVIKNEVEMKNLFFPSNALSITRIYIEKR